MLDKIESFRHISHAAEDISTIPEKVAHCFNNGPGAHVRGDTGLVGELKVIYTEVLAKKKRNDPIQ